MVTIEETLKHESLWVEVGEAEKQSRLHLKRFYTDSQAPAALMVHGSIESGRIFYSKSHKGLAPFLAQQGFDVYVVDLRGRGESQPAVSNSSTNTQLDAILEEIPACIEKIRGIRGGNVELHALAHSWGGVMLLAYLARNPQESFKSLCFFGTKRSISVWNIKKFIAVDVVWVRLGEYWTKKYGFFPAKEKKIGSDSESAQVYRHCRDWVLSLDSWTDPEDGFDYLSAFKNADNIPPTLYLAGINDPYLGNPIDVKRLMAEVGNPKDKLRVLSKKNGNKLNYGHIDMCTAKEGSQDHFPEVVEWMRGS